MDTNVLIHALTNDNQGAECRRVSEVWSELVIDRASDRSGHPRIHLRGHPLSQANDDRQDVADYLIAIDDATGRATRLTTLRSNPCELGRAHRGVGFVDAYLAVRARRDRMPVYTKTLRHFTSFDVDVPTPLAVRPSIDDSRHIESLDVINLEPIIHRLIPQ